MDKLTRVLKSLGLVLSMLSCISMFDACAHKTSVTSQPASNEKDGWQNPNERREDVDAVLIFMPDKKNFKDTWTALMDELVEDFDVFTHVVTNETTIEDMGRKISEIQPSCLVLMNNKTVKLYELYQKSQPKNTSFPPSVLVMASYVGQIYKRVANSTGIAYEIPVVTSITKLRTILKTPIQKVGVVYRTPFKKYLHEQALLAKREKIEIVSVDVGREPKARNIKRAIQSLTEVQKSDALWVLNDNVLLAGKNALQFGWLPAIDNIRIPVIVGVENLVSKNFHFGAFAMVPDHAGLGVQTANIIYELYDNEWELGGRQVEQPLSMKTIVDAELVRTRFKFREEMANYIDVLVE